jgi:hypothetical protein
MHKRRRKLILMSKGKGENARSIHKPISIPSHAPKSIHFSVSHPSKRMWEMFHDLHLDTFAQRKEKSRPKEDGTEGKLPRREEETGKRREGGR